MRVRSVLLAWAMAGLLVLPPTARAQDALGGGSAFPAALYARWIEMAKAQAGIAIAFNAAEGSAVGQNRMLAQEIDFTVAGMPMPKERRDDSRVLQFPAVIGAVVCVYNIPGAAGGQLKLNADLLARIFTGAIRTWNDPAIRAINPGMVLPDMEIKPISLRDGGMDATFGLTQYILASNPEWRSKHGNVVTKRWAIGSMVINSVDMVEVVKVVPGSIGYTAYGLALRSGMTMAALRNPAGNYIAPSLPAIAAAANKADWAKAEELVMTLVNQPGAETYPIAQTSYVQMPLAPKYIGRSQVVRNFFDFGYRNGGAVAADFGFVPLPQSVQDEVRSAWSRIGS